MRTAILVQKSDTRATLNWAARFARAASGELVVFYLARECEGFHRTPIEALDNLKLRNAASAIATELQPAPDGNPVQLYAVSQQAPERFILQAITDLQIGRLMLLRGRGVKTSSPEFEVEQALFRDAGCEVIKLSIGESNGDRCDKILVGVGLGPSTHAALQLATALAANADGRVTALYVEPDKADLAVDVARRTTERIVADAVRVHRDRVEVELAVGVDVIRGLRAASKGCDLLILGASHHSVIHRWLFSSVSEKLIAQHDGPTIAVIRPALPWGSRIRRSVEQLVRETVPQLDRPRRLQLFERIHDSSQWNFDFIALISLSTLIATLGLLQNSAAVVIGAMLVAPLMTPLLGIGLAITQGNLVLGKMSARTVGLGFLSSFVIGLLTAVLTPGSSLTEQIMARGSPGVVDLLVAFFSGMAAAYAIGRPNLLSALPGVAIAAALVPPVASSAAGVAHGDTGLATGAITLFLTNIVAIVLGAALSFWLSGIRVLHAHGGFASWSRFAAFGLFTLALTLAAYESLPRNQNLNRLKAELSSLSTDNDQLEVTSVTLIGTRREPVVSVSVSAPGPIGEESLRGLAATARRHFPNAAGIDVHLQHVQRIDFPTD